MRETEPDLARVLPQFALLRSLEPEQLRELAAQCRRRSLVARESLFHRGTPCRGFYGVEAGMMQLSVSNAEGMEKVVEIVGPWETSARR